MNHQDQINIMGTLTTDRKSWTIGWTRGWTFYACKDRTVSDAVGSPTIFFPGPGYRDIWSGQVPPATGGAISVGYNGDYWAGVPNSATKGCHLHFFSITVHPKGDLTRANGFSIRPVREQ